MKAEFEEREFEGPLNYELSAGHGCPYAPGQVLENTVGIDAGLVCQSTSFWKRFQHPPRALYPLHHTPSGFQLNPLYWAELDQALPIFPPILFNLFLQHKRPDYLVGPSSTEWATWNAPYYRYDIQPHQQVALEKLSSLAGLEALVAYSCAAFHTYADLWAKAQSGDLVASTNFVHADRLKEHEKYTYQSADCVGFAHSEPEEVPPMDFHQELSTRREQLRPRGNLEQLFSLGEMVNEAIAENPLAPRYRQFLDRFPGDIGRTGRTILQVASFARITGTKWFYGLEKLPKPSAAYRT